MTITLPAQRYFQLINKCLVQLRFDPVTSFGALVDAIHLSLKQALNTINNEIVNQDSERWTFRERSDYTFVLVEGQEAYDMPDGLIHKITVEDMRDPLGYEYDYLSRNKTVTGNTRKYAVYENQIRLCPPPNSQLAGKTATVYYHIDKPAVSGTTGLPVEEMTGKDDYTIIPVKFQDVLVFGACWDVKGRPEQGRYQHFGTRYKDLLKMMLHECRSTVEQETFFEYEQGSRTDAIVQEFFKDC